MCNVIGSILLIVGTHALAKEAAAAVNHLHDAQGSVDREAEKFIDRSVDNLLYNLLARVTEPPPEFEFEFAPPTRAAPPIAGSRPRTDLDGTVLAKRPPAMDYTQFREEDIPQAMTNMGDAVDTNGHVRCTLVSTASWPPRIKASVSSSVDSTSGPYNGAVEAAARGWPPKLAGAFALKRHLGTNDLIGNYFCQLESPANWPPQPVVSLSNSMEIGPWHLSGLVHTAMWATPNAAAGLSAEKRTGLVRGNFDGSGTYKAYFDGRTYSKSLQGEGTISLNKDIGKDTVSCALGGPVAWPPQLSLTVQGSKATGAGVIESALKAPVDRPQEMMGSMTIKNNIGPLGFMLQMATTGQITCVLQGAARKITPLVEDEQSAKQHQKAREAREDREQQQAPAERRKKKEEDDEPADRGRKKQSQSSRKKKQDDDDDA